VFRTSALLCVPPLANFCRRSLPVTKRDRRGVRYVASAAGGDLRGAAAVVPTAREPRRHVEPAVIVTDRVGSVSPPLHQAARVG
jgi:hypothetical protein